MDKHEVTADWGEILSQSRITAKMFLEHAIEDLAEIQGTGPDMVDTEYALRLAELTAADFRSAAISVGAQQLAKAIESLQR